jgi:hypothetical protein
MNTASRISVILLFLCGIVSVQAEPISGLSVGAGIGSMIAMDEKSYMNSGMDLYPECFVSYDRNSLVAEASVGWLYREGKVKLVVGNKVLAEESYTEAFIPVALTVKFLPLRKGNPDSAFQPFVGLGAGCLFASGDNEDTFFSLSPDLGVSLGRKHILELDCAYNLVLGEDDLIQGDNLDYLKLSLRYKYRFALSK